jgi:hypothetical protein
MTSNLDPTRQIPEACVSYQESDESAVRLPRSAVPSFLSKFDWEIRKSQLLIARERWLSIVCHPWPMCKKVDTVQVPIHRVLTDNIATG